MPALTCREVRSLEPGDALWTPWKDLQTRIAPELSLFGPEWFAIWSQTHGCADGWLNGLRLLAVTDENNVLRGVMAFSEQRKSGLHVKASAGYFQPWRCILADRAFAADVGCTLGKYIARSGWSACQLGPMRRSSPATAAFVESMAARRTMFTKSSAPLAICHAPATWDEYKQTVLGGKFFRKIGTYERKMQRAGRTEIEHIRRPNPEQTRRLIDDLAEIEQRSWLVDTARGKTRFTASTAQTFWTRLIDEALSPLDQFDAWIIRFDGRPVSFCVTLTSLPARYVIANQYDDAVADYRTGSTLYRYMIEEGLDRGVRTFDFGDGGIEYKKLWGAEYVDTVDTLLVAPHPLANLVLPCAYRARECWRSWRAKTRPIETRPTAVESLSPPVEEQVLAAANELIDVCEGQPSAEEKPLPVGEVDCAAVG